MRNPETLRACCEHEVAREIARPRAKGTPWSAGPGGWAYETDKALPEAGEKINAMTNLELLELIGRVMSQDA